MEAEEVAEGAAQVVEDPSSVANRAHDRGDVVVEQNQARGLASDLGAAFAHRDPDVGFPQRERVVRTVTGHRHDLAARAQRAHDRQLLLGARAGEDSRAVNQRVELVRRRCGQGVSRHHPLGVLPEAARTRHGAGRGRVIAGDHHDPHRRGATGRQRIGRVDPNGIAKRSKPEQLYRLRVVRASDREHAHPASRHFFVRPVSFAGEPVVGADERQDILHRALDGIHGAFVQAPAFCGVAPASFVGSVLDQRCRRSRVADRGACERRIERIGAVRFARQERGLDDRLALSAAEGDDFRELDPTVRERPGLVDADRRGRTQRLDAGEPAYERAVARKAPRSEGEVERVHHRQLFGDRCHRKADRRDDRQRPRRPVTALDQNDGDADDHHDDADPRDELTDRGFDRRARGLQFAEQDRDRTVARRRAGCRDARERAAAHHGGSRGDGGSFTGYVLDGDRLAGQRRLVDGKVTLEQLGVGGYDVALGDDEQIAGHDRGRGDLLLAAVANDPRARRGERAKPRQGRICAALEHDADQHDRQQRDARNDRVGPVAEDRVGHRRDDEQHRHRIGRDPESPRQHRGHAPFSRRDVRSEQTQCVSGLSGGEAGERFDGR